LKVSIAVESTQASFKFKSRSPSSRSRRSWRRG